MARKPATVENRSVTFDGVTYLTCPTVITSVMRDGQCHVHAAGCADLKKSMYKECASDIENPIEIRSLSDAVNEVYGPQAGSFYAEAGLKADDPNAWRYFGGDLRIFSCISLPEEPIAVAAEPQPESEVGVQVVLDREQTARLIERLAGALVKGDTVALGIETNAFGHLIVEVNGVGAADVLRVAE